MLYVSNGTKYKAYFCFPFKKPFYTTVINLETEAFEEAFNLEYMNKGSKEWQLFKEQMESE
jgi:hypothetical protein